MKKIRMILPVVAVLFAIAGALATNASPRTDVTDINVSIQGAPCDVDGFCRLEGETQCKSGTQLLDQAGGTCPAFTQDGTFHAL